MTWFKAMPFKEFLSTENIFIRSCALVFGVLAVFRGAGLPLAWSATQAQVDYRAGFVKRGLFGQVFTRTLHLQYYWRFTLFSYVLLAFALSLFIWLVLKSGVLERVEDGSAVLVFSSSFAVTFLCHLVGYFDVVHLLLVLALLLIRNSTVRFLSAVPVCVVCILIHEAFLLTLLPVLCFSFFADVLERRLTAKTAMCYAASLSVLSAGLCVWAAGSRTKNPAAIQTLQQQICYQVDFPIQPEFFEVYRKSLADNIRATVHMHLTGQETGAEVSSWIVFGPVIIFLLYYVRKFCEVIGDPVIRRLCFRLSVAAVCGPLAMQLLGWDIGRWYMLATIVAFLLLVLLTRAMPGSVFPLRPFIPKLSLLIVGLNMAGGDMMMSNNYPNPYPFIRPLQRTVRSVLRTHRLQPVRSFDSSSR